VSPLALDFGDVAVGSSAALMVTGTNLGAADLVVSGIDFGAGSSPDFSVTSAPALPATLPPVASDPVGGTADVEVAFAPSAQGVASATLEIASDDADEPVVAVALSGNGVSVEPPPAEQIQAILDAFDTAVATGDLYGDGPNAKSAAGRQGALRNMLLASGDLIRDGLVAEACQQLLDAVKRMDGEFPPPDFVAGEAADDIAAMIHNLRGSLGCNGG
jgi:hypothetical protein